ncbi:MAG: aspartyl protease family protein [Candidatus Limnocylindria bacterium]
MSARVLLDVPITFDVGGEVTHAPMIEVDVGGTATKLIVDTGSTDHVLTMELAERAGLEASAGEAGTDSVGASVPSLTLGEVPVRIGELDIRLQNVVAIAGPAPFEGWGVGGFLSPQHVQPNAWVVIDLVDGGFTFVGGEEADVTAWVADRYPALQMLALEREAGDSTILVRAAIEPFDPVVTMLDTGGKRTAFAEAAVPTLFGGTLTESGRGVGGSAAIGSEVADQVLRAGAATLPVPSLLVREEIGTAQALVGMDLLRGTVLVVSADPLRPVLWLVPQPAV